MSSDEQEQDGTLKVVVLACVEVPLPAAADGRKDGWDFRVADRENWTNGTIVDLGAWDAGLWQWFNERLVPISEDEYYGHVPHCWTGACDRCQRCVSEREWFAERARRIEQLGMLIGPLVEELGRVSREFSTVREYNIGDDFDFDDADDAEHDLEEAARRLRAVQRITRLNWARIKAL